MFQVIKYAINIQSKSIIGLKAKKSSKRKPIVSYDREI